MIKWTQFQLILLFVIGLPLLQLDQLIDYEWLVCENSVVTSFQHGNPLSDEQFAPDSKIVSSFFPNSFLSQLKNPLSVLSHSFQRASPFWRPPPAFTPKK